MQIMVLSVVLQNAVAIYMCIGSSIERTLQNTMLWPQDQEQGQGTG